jgi:ubiquinone/menaquinone biosynthesis C-methylase UbiE
MKESASKRKIKQFYEQVYKSGDIRDNIRQYRRIFSLIKLYPDMRLLDIGCGCGYLSYTAKSEQIDIYGMDISFNALSKGKQNFPFLKVCVANGENVPFKDESFDVVFCLGALEHFLQPEIGIEEIKRVLKKEGFSIMVLPNSFSLKNISRVLFKGDVEEQWQIQEKNLTKEQWRELIEANGLKVKSVYKYNKYPELFREGTYKMKSLKKYFRNLLMSIFCPLNFSWQFIFVCSKNNL